MSISLLKIQAIIAHHISQATRMAKYERKSHFSVVDHDGVRGLEGT
jgi:hypothetical protein